MTRFSLQVSFSWTLAAEEEDIVELDAARAAEMKPRKPRGSSSDLPQGPFKKKVAGAPSVSKARFGADASTR